MSSLLSSVSYTAPEKSCLKKRAENESGYMKISNLMFQIPVELESSNYTTPTFSGFSQSLYTN